MEREWDVVLVTVLGRASVIESLVPVLVRASEPELARESLVSVSMAVGTSM